MSVHPSVLAGAQGIRVNPWALPCPCCAAQLQGLGAMLNPPEGSLGARNLPQYPSRQNQAHFSGF